jgi:hypothetical protein
MLSDLAGVCECSPRAGPCLGVWTDGVWISVACGDANGGYSSAVLM